MAGKDDQFEASASALGYLYQFAKALQICIEQWVGGLEWSVAVEAADDIEKHAGSLTELLQLKQRAEGTRLTDSALICGRHCGSGVRRLRAGGSTSLKRTCF
ncbi:hypothetical protein AB6O49_00055 [Streptomyces sp. SBR177]